MLSEMSEVTDMWIQSGLRYRRGLFSSCARTAISMLVCSAGCWAQQNAVQPLVVSVEIVKGSPIYRVNRKIVEDTRSNSLLTNLEGAALERGLDYPVIVIVDVQ